MKHPIKISQAEWEVMTVAWKKSPVAASEIVGQLAPKNNWHPRTIRTLLARLVGKRALRAARDGKRYLYEPKVTMEECVQHESRSFLERVFGGAPASMLINLVKHAELRPEEIQQLKRILSEKEK
ncbi:MAG: BlaI/MecI/CopY family transcriptional regulator [Verrucomicrobia bacterium]|nr:BlaI/MecI/CopY family transcriptional regulator [Verrucomicrobiota bacterium]